LRTDDQRDGLSAIALRSHFSIFFFTLYKYECDVAQDLRMISDDRRKRLRVEFQRRRRDSGHHVRGPGFTGQERHFANDFTVSHSL